MANNSKITLEVTEAEFEILGWALQDYVSKVYDLYRKAEMSGLPVKQIYDYSSIATNLRNHLYDRRNSGCKDP